MPATVVTRLPILRALLAQLLALLVVWLLLLGLVGVLGVRPGLILVAVAQGCLAALIGARLGLSAWWLAINLMFVPGLALLRDIDVPGWLPLGAFTLLLLLNWNAFTERVPLYLTGREAERQLRNRLSELPRVSAISTWAAAWPARCRAWHGTFRRRSSLAWKPRR